MRRSLVVVLAGCAILVNACVSAPTQEDNVTTLEEPRNTPAQSVTEIAELEQERARLIEELMAAQAGREKALSDLELHHHYLENERQILNQAQSRLSELRHNYQQLGWERDQLQKKVEDLTVQLEKASQDLTGSRQSLGDAQTRIRDLKQERDKVNAALAKALEQAKGLEAALAADHESWTRLRKALSKVENIDDTVVPY